MRKVIDAISLRCISHATEDLEKVKKAMAFIAGRTDLKITRTKGYHGNEINILTLTIKKSKEIESFWYRMLDVGVVNIIAPELDKIVDEECIMHLRFDKQEAYQERIAFTTGGDAIVIHMKILSYPRRKSEALKNFKNFIRRIQYSQ